jgi:hypothetical protein
VDTSPGDWRRTTGQGGVRGAQHHCDIEWAVEDLNL